MTSKGPRGRPQRSGPMMFHELAGYYDALNAWKDYRSESVRLEGIARRYGRSGGTSWLDVACGTGKHLEFLRRGHDCVGVDGSAEMLRLARRRLPGVRLVHADMRTFRLEQEFDVVSCLFSAVGHLRTERDLALAFANFARHAKPGGVVIAEPWIDPAKFRKGMVHLRTYDTPSVKAVRVAYSSRRGKRSRIHYHYLIAEAGRGIRHLSEADEGLLVSRGRLVELMRRAGLDARFLPRGLWGDRGLLVGVKRGPTSHGVHHRPGRRAA